MASTSGVVDEGERQMIHSVFELGDTLVREVMVPAAGRGVDRARHPRRQGAAAGAEERLLPASRCSARTSTTSSASPTSRTWSAPRARQAGRPDAGALTDVMRPAVFVPDSKRVDELLKEMQAHPQPHGDRGRRVRRHRGRRDHRGHPRGDRRRDHRRVRHRRGARRRRCSTAAALRLSARLPVEDLARAVPGVDGPRRAALVAVLAEADVDTVGGLLAQQLGKVPLPGAEAEVAGPAPAGRGRQGRPRPGADHHRAGQPPTRRPGTGCTAATAPTASSTDAEPDDHATDDRRRGADAAAGRRAMPATAELETSTRRTRRSSRWPARRAPGSGRPRARRSATPTAAPTPRPPSTLASLQLTALQAAVAAAVSSGAPGLEAAAVVTTADVVDPASLACRARPRAGRPGRCAPIPPARVLETVAAVTTPALRRRRGRRRHRRPGHRARRGPHRALGGRASSASRGWPTHQTGHNSNVIHSGLYYAPGGLKARLAVAGCAETVAFCREHDLPHAVTRQAGGGHRARRAAPDGRAGAPRRRPTASRRTSWTRPGCASTSRTCAGIAALLRAVHRHLRLPADRREARRAGRQGGRRDPPRPRGVGSWCAGAPTSWCAPTAGDLLGTPGRGLRRAALRRAGPGLGRRPGRADPARSAASTPASADRPRRWSRA